jgi:hypothetical protein
MLRKQLPRQLPIPKKLPIQPQQRTQLAVLLCQQVSLHTNPRILQWLGVTLG